MWRGQRLERPVVLSTSLCYSLGAVVSPLIASDFLLQVSSSADADASAGNDPAVDQIMEVTSLNRTGFGSMYVESIERYENEALQLSAQLLHLQSSVNNNNTLASLLLSNNASASSDFRSSCTHDDADAVVPLDTALVRNAYGTMASPYLLLACIFLTIAIITRYFAVKAAADRNKFTKVKVTCVGICEHGAELGGEQHLLKRSDSTDSEHSCYCSHCTEAVIINIPHERSPICTRLLAFKVAFVAMTMLFYFSFCFCESVPSAVLMSIAVDVLDYTERQAALLLTAFLAGCLVGRVAGTPVSASLSPTVLIGQNLVDVTQRISLGYKHNIIIIVLAN